MRGTSEVNRDNPYLLGSFAPVDEERTCEDLEVIGEIPADLQGVIARNGPNPRFAPPGRHHWFDGDGMIHAVAFDGGKAVYRNRWVRTRAWRAEDEAQRALWSGIMEPISGNPRGAPYKDSANTDLAFFDGELVALWYICGEPYRVDPVTLETLGPADFGKGRPLRISAHTKVDEQTGEMMFFDYGPKPPYMSYGVVGPGGTIVHHVPVELPGPRLPHDMAITERYSILMDLPVVQKPDVKGRWSVDYHRDMPARFGVVPRHGDDLRWFEAEPCYIYHSVNAWEEDGAIVMVGCRTSEPLPEPDPAVGKWAAMMANLKINARLHRWRFDLETGQTHEEPLDDRYAEFPMMNTARLGRRTRYSYHQILADTPTLRFGGIIKYDTESSSSTAIDYGPGRYGSESPFAPRGGASAEDDGYLLSFVHDERADRSELCIYHAQHLTDGPLGRVILPVRVPLGFHACWAPGAGSSA